MKLKIIVILMATLLFHASVGESRDQETKWTEKKGRHFIVYSKDAPDDFVKSVERSAEQYYDEITRGLGFTRYKGWTFDERAEIYIYDDQIDFVEKGRFANWSHGVASPRSKIIRTFPTAHGFFDSTLPHELGHIIFREFIGYRSRIPLWFEEGVAMYQEKARRFGSHKVVQQAIEEESFIPLDELSHVRLTNRTDKRIVDLFYAESASAVYFLIGEFGQHRFVRFCRKLESGRKFEWALKSVYVRFKTLKDLNKAWVRHLEK